MDWLHSFVDAKPGLKLTNSARALVSERNSIMAARHDGGKTETLDDIDRWMRVGLSPAEQTRPHAR